MKLLGLVLLIGGFLWIGWDAAVGFSDDQHTIWVAHTQHLSSGETLTRDQASIELRQLSLALKDRHRVVILPAILMLAGGLISALSNRKQVHDTHS